MKQNAAPTSAPTFAISILTPEDKAWKYCTPFSSSNSSSATSNYISCYIRTCEQGTITFSLWKKDSSQSISCTADTFLRIYSEDKELGWNDDIDNTNRCSEITLNTPTQCIIYEIRQGCYGKTSCSGRIGFYYNRFLSLTPSSSPTIVPAVTASQTISPFVWKYCDQYTTSNTADATNNNTAICQLSTCVKEGDFMVLTTLSNYINMNSFCRSDTYLRLFA
jgi:hypothetical protein